MSAEGRRDRAFSVRMQWGHSGTALALLDGQRRPANSARVSGDDVLPAGRRFARVRALPEQTWTAAFMGWWLPVTARLYGESGGARGASARFSSPRMVAVACGSFRDECLM